jgi:hypothetical protein
MANTGHCGCSSRAGETNQPDIPIACDLTVFTPTERTEHFERTGRLLSSIAQLEEDGQGFTLTFASTPAVEDLLPHWIENERRCCPFFTFDVDRPAAANVSLRIWGPDGAKEILRTALDGAGVLAKFSSSHS